MKTTKILILISFILVSGCALNEKSAITDEASNFDRAHSAYNKINQVLVQSGDTIDYDTLLWVHSEMIQNNSYIANQGELIGSLIRKRNDNTRVDNIILISAADIIRNSQVAIDDVGGLFRFMLLQDQRLNTWVLYYIGIAIADYVYYIPEGDLLADMLEQRVAEHFSESIFSEEYFGYHFLPPPKQQYLINYIANIDDTKTRVLERICYYDLIKSEWSEAQIEKALRQLQTQGIPGTGEKTQRPLKYLIMYPDQFEDLSDTSK